MSCPKAKCCFVFFLVLTILSSLNLCHARDSQFFNKLPGAVNKDFVPLDGEQHLSNDPLQEPSFQRENENSYGLYGQEPGQLPPSTATTLSKYLPKNYNPVAYVTEPEDSSDAAPFPEEENYPNRNRFENHPNTESGNNYNSYYNSDPEGTSVAGENDFEAGAATTSLREDFNYGSETSGYRPQGMSDTRTLENGKFFYDLNAAKYSSNHPYANLRDAGARNAYGSRNYYRNGYDFNGGNSGGGYQNEDEFADEDVNNDLP